MNVYKLQTDEVEERIIEREHFENETLRQPPWFATTDQGADIHFAVCPSCDNPIQVVGLYKLPENIKNPYGRHYPKTVPGLAGADAEARENCPYFKPRQHAKVSRKRSPKGLPTKILEILVEQFDRVIYLLQKEMGFGISYNLAERMLAQYGREQGHMYTGATLTNIPWVFAYMADSQSLFGQKIHDAALKDSILQNVEGVSFSRDDRVESQTLLSGKKAFFELDVCFIKHRFRKDEMESGLLETMEMVVSTNKHGKAQEIYKKQITFDHQFFSRLIALSEDHAQRKMKYVESARRILGS